MQVRGIEHVNIVADDLDATIAFYADVLGLVAGRPPMAPPGFAGCWLHDAAGHPIVHLMAYDEGRHAARTRGPQTGSIDHVALAATGFAAMLERCRALGVAHRVNDRAIAGLRQIFVTDPNGVVLELNFATD